MIIADNFLKQLIERKGSDLHLSAGNPPLFRLNGELVRSDLPILTDANIKELLAQILPQSSIKKLLEESSLDFMYVSQGLKQRFRSNAFFQKTGISVVFRWIPRDIPSLEELGIGPEARKLVAFHQGIVLITGSSGSGKTTTMAALIDLLNTERSLHIITIEDPIEYVHSNKKSLIIQREVGTHVESFSTALKAALREDPDVILIGELRDLETISLAITAAETGHLVFATINTNSAVQTVDRIIDAYPADQQAQIRVMFSESLRAILSQQLIINTNGDSRVCAYELLFSNSSIANLIRDAKQHQMNTAMQTGKKFGMRLMDHSLASLVLQGKISEEEAIARSSDPKTFKEKFLKPNA